MEIHGLQKMTLLDYPGKVACTVFLSGCDFRCPFCHNGGLVTGTCPPETDDQGLLAFLNSEWAYVETTIENQPCRAFIPRTALMEE